MLNTQGTALLLYNDTIKCINRQNNDTLPHLHCTLQCYNQIRASYFSSNGTKTWQILTKHKTRQNTTKNPHNSHGFAIQCMEIHITCFFRSDSSPKDGGSADEDEWSWTPSSYPVVKKGYCSFSLQAEILFLWLSVSVWSHKSQKRK